MKKQVRNAIINAGLGALYFSGAHHLLRPRFSGVGAIFMLHHVRPARPSDFQPNRQLEVTPEFLRATLVHLKSQQIDVVTMDEMHHRLVNGVSGRRFAAFTFDDGYRDNRDHALPIMREFAAPFSMFVTTDFAEGSGRLWWIALERVLAKSSAVDVEIGNAPVRFETSTARGKQIAFERIHDWLRSLSEDDLRREITALCDRNGVDLPAICREHCLSWDELQSFADDPLVTIGGHTITHCNLAHQSDAMASDELTVSRARIEEKLQKPVSHLAYPYGDRNAAQRREFAMASATGYKTAVTTRPGMMFAENAEYPMALPRISLNGNFQNARMLPVLTSGAATAMWNGFRRVVAA